MAYRVRFLVALFCLAAAESLFAQGRPFPSESREPPLADDSEPNPTRAKDPDEVPVRRAQHVVPVPAPGALPATLDERPILPAGYTGPITQYGELPTPAVSLNIEGSDVSPSGQPVVYKLIVRNNSAAKAHNVVLRLIPPKNAERVKWEPVPTHDEAEARWEFKVLEPGQTRTVEVSYRPKPDTDEVKIQARVQFDFGRGMITKVSAPSLSVRKEGPEKLVVNDTETYRITVSNNGQVSVRDIVVTDRLVKGLTHDDRELARGTVDGRLTSSIEDHGLERTWSIPALAPGEKRVIEYRIKAREVGKFGSNVNVKVDGMQPKKTELDVDVQRAALKLDVIGPPNLKATVGQAAVYKVTIQNVGSADLRNVTARCLFPPDMRATRATNEGQPFRDSVQWVFKQLKAGESKELTVGLTTSTPGMRTIQFALNADKAKVPNDIQRTEFVGLPNIDWDVDVPGTATTGKALTYKVTVSNRGTAPSRVELIADLPANVQYKSSNPTASPVTGQNAQAVRFPVYEIPQGKKTTYTIEVAARRSGEAKVIFTLRGDGIAAEGKRQDGLTNIVGTDDRSPTGPVPVGPRPALIGAAGVKD